ncbi:MAG: hypothetical protein INH37_21290, partial [Myxococcaceae bacterium]|nr:hypothetical protein [Myxococcaceae bacterium]
VSTQQLNKLAIRRSATGAAEEVVAVGNRCELLTKVGNGISRVDLSSVCRFDSLTSALFTPGGGLIIGGTEALLLQRVSGSQTFVKEFFTDVDPFLVVIDDLFYANDAVWAVVRAGGLFQRVGSQWRAYQPNAMGLGLSAGTFDARDGIFAVGEGGLVIRRSNPP